MLESLLNPQVLTGLVGAVSGAIVAYVTGRFGDRKSSREIDLEYDKFVQEQLSEMFQTEKTLLWQAFENERVRLNARIAELEDRERQLQDRIHQLEYQLGIYRDRANQIIAEKDRAITERDNAISRLQQQLGTCQVALKEIHAKHQELVDRIGRSNKPKQFPAPSPLSE